jgi:glycosyltransferase involved in cell wall biosynthesis
MLGLPRDRPIVLSVRRQVRRMGLENLIDAVLDIRKQVPDILVLLGGTGPLMGELRDRIASQGLDQNVRQLGRIEDANLPTAYRAADLSVVPTQTLEGFGMITLESLASGTPVLVTPIGGLPEVILPFAPECVFEGTSSAVIAATLSDFLTGRSTLPSEKSCRNYATANFSWPIIAAAVRRIYEEALSSA